jgi:hypothetical protein
MPSRPLPLRAPVDSIDIGNETPTSKVAYPSKL